MTANDLQSAGATPEGVAGLLIDDIELRAILRTARGMVAQVSSRGDRKSYLLKDGDQLSDGDVVVIRSKEVVFKQVIRDPTASKPFREVVKTLPGA